MLSTREWLRLVVLTGVNLLLFREIWWLLIFPPVALVTVIVNLGLACTWVRPRSLNGAVMTSMGVGLFVVFSSLLYLACLVEGSLRAPMASAILHALPDPLQNALPDTLRSAWGIQLLDFASLDTIGIAAMVVTGWLAWLPARPRQTASAS